MHEPIRGLVEVDWLSHQLATNDDVLVLHTAMTNPFSREKPLIGERVIPCARHVDIEQVFCDPDNPLPHTMPSADEFERQVRRLGINRNTVLIVYDDEGIYCSPRVWWMFKTMGHQQIYVLNGGLPAWLNRGFSYESGFSKTTTEGNFEVNYDPNLTLDLTGLLHVIDDANTKVVDARSSGRFYGNEQEPRVGVRQGHIPGSKSLPFEKLLGQGYMEARPRLANHFKALNLDKENRLIFSCGSGVTACVLALAAYEIGYSLICVYDGS